MGTFCGRCFQIARPKPFERGVRTITPVFDLARVRCVPLVDISLVPVHASFVLFCLGHSLEVDKIKEFWRPSEGIAEDRRGSKRIEEDRRGSKIFCARPSIQCTTARRFLPLAVAISRQGGGDPGQTARQSWALHRHSPSLNTRSLRVLLLLPAFFTKLRRVWSRSCGGQTLCSRYRSGDPSTCRSSKLDGQTPCSSYRSCTGSTSPSPELRGLHPRQVTREESVCCKIMPGHNWTCLTLGKLNMGAVCE